MGHDTIQGKYFKNFMNRQSAPRPRLLALALVMQGALGTLGCSGGGATDLSSDPDAQGTGGVGEGNGSGDGGSDGTGGSGVSTMTGTDVCGERPTVEWSAAGDDGFVTVPPGDPMIRFGGRVDCTDLSAPAFAFPAASITIRFVGSGLDIILADEGTGTVAATNFYDVSIDGGAPFVVEAIPGESVYNLARDLSEGEHTALVVRRTESSSGRSALLGIRLPEGAQLLPVETSGRRVEFVGDSITCGYGNEISTTDPDSFHYTARNSNANLAYGAVAARLLNAEYTAVSYSGRGVSRNVGGGSGQTLPQMYAQSFADDPASPLFPVANAIPDALVINLGTNDFSPGGVDREAYVARYVEFLETLRGYYPETAFVCAVGPMMSDFYPVGEKAWTNVRADVKTVIAERAAAGDTNITYLEFAPQVSPYGEDWHPTVATHAQMAEQTAAVLRGLLGW